jgi:hypothetical protein
VSILRPRRPMRRGRTKSTSHWPGTPSRIVSRGPTPKERGPPFVRGMRYFCRIPIGCPGPGIYTKWPACKGMFPNTNCRSCATADVENEYVYDPASCGCGVLRKDRASNCSECDKERNELRDCDTEGCGKKRHGREPYCKHCRNMSLKRPMTCFLCGGGITRSVCNRR